MVYTRHHVSNFWEHTFSYIKATQREHVFTLCLNRPEKRNAMNSLMMEEIAFALAYAHHSEAVWALVLEANGTVFCAGADLKAWAGEPAEGAQSTVPPANGEVLLGELLLQVHKPCIAKVHAPVYAGGHLLVGGCTYVVAVRDAVFGLPEVRRGVFPMQVMATLLKVVPARQMLDWCIRGLTKTAEEAFRLGLVTHLVQDGLELDKAVNQLLDEILVNSPTAIRMGLRAYDDLRAIPDSEAHGYLKSQLTALLSTQDAKEGLNAFREKRKPVWTGS